MANNTESKDDHHHDHEISIEELVHGNNIVMNALIDLLIEKKLISEEDLQGKLQSMGCDCSD